MTRTMVIAAATLALALALALAPAQAMARSETAPGAIAAAFEALAQGRTAEAMARLQENGGGQSSDPAVLINLGTAYARQCRIEEARAMFEAAAKSGERYDLELADGRWVDSRWAARMALAGLAERGSGAMR